MASNINVCDTEHTLSLENEPTPRQGGYQPLKKLPEGYSLAACILPSRETRTNIMAVSERLQREFPNHHYAPRKYLHMTLAQLGVVAVATEEAARQLVRDRYDKDLRRISKNTPAFKTVIQSMNHFPNCIFAQVSQEGDCLEDLRADLTEVAPGIDQPGFVPHITVGYPDPEEYANDLFTTINTLYADTPFGKDNVGHFSITALHTRFSLDDPDPIRILATYPLTGR